MKNSICLILVMALIGCTNVERGTGQVLDNANSALKAAPKDLWITEGGEGSERDQRAEESEQAKRDREALERGRL